MEEALKQYTETPDNLFALLSRYRVIVPGIQRHYVQGADNPKAESVRKKFIEDLFNAFCEEKPIHLQFIYGPIQTEGEDAFVPVDGQQRLTTLWLIARYTAERIDDKSAKSSLLHLLSRFTYADRIHATRFCKAICSENNTWSTQEAPSIAIKKQAWFWDYWKQDETVASMLRTLDTIHDEWIKHEPITTDEIINGLAKRATFSLKIDAFGDDIYMKMNARGLQLTQWENFKGQFANLLSDNTKSTWEGKIEQYANDYFVAAGEILPDNAFFALMGRLANYCYKEKEVSDSKKGEENPIGNQLSQLVSFTSSNWNEAELPFVSFSEFEKVLKKAEIDIKKFAKVALNVIGLVLDAANERSPYWSEGTRLFNSFFNPKNQNEADLSLCIFVYCRKFFDRGPSMRKPSMDDFRIARRFMWNILENVSRDGYNRVDIVNSFAEKGIPTLYSADASDLADVYEDTSQVVEEIEKAKKFHDAGWDKQVLKTIHEAEEFAFFNGTIRFLYTDGNGKVNWNNFSTKFYTCCQIFDKEGLSAWPLANKVLLSHCAWNTLIDKSVFGRSAGNWKGILIDDDLKSPVDGLLLNAQMNAQTIKAVKDQTIKLLLSDKFFEKFFEKEEIVDNIENYVLRHDQHDDLDYPQLYLKNYPRLSLRLCRHNREKVIEEVEAIIEKFFPDDSQFHWERICEEKYYYRDNGFSFTYNKHNFIWQDTGWIDLCDKDWNRLCDKSEGEGLSVDGRDIEKVSKLKDKLNHFIETYSSKILACNG